MPAAEGVSGFLRCINSDLLRSRFAEDTDEARSPGGSGMRSRGGGIGASSEIESAMTEIEPRSSWFVV